MGVTVAPMKPLLLVLTLITATLLAGCETRREFKGGGSLSLKFSPDPAAQKEAADRLADELHGFRK